MLSKFIWLVAMAGSLAVVSIAAAHRAETAHLVANALVCLSMLAAAVAQLREGTLAGRTDRELVAGLARHMAHLWAWSAVSAYIVYAFVFDWQPWRVLVGLFAVAAAVFMAVAYVLERPAALPGWPAVTPKQVLIWWQWVLVALLVGAASTLGAGRMRAHGLPADSWVALNLILCGAATMVSVAGFLVFHERKAPSEG